MVVKISDTNKKLNKHWNEKHQQLDSSYYLYKNNTSYVSEKLLSDLYEQKQTNDHLFSDIEFKKFLSGQRPYNMKNPLIDFTAKRIYPELDVKPYIEYDDNKSLEENLQYVEMVRGSPIDPSKYNDVINSLYFYFFWLFVWIAFWFHLARSVEFTNTIFYKIWNFLVYKAIKRDLEEEFYIFFIFSFILFLYLGLTTLYVNFTVHNPHSIDLLYIANEILKNEDNDEFNFPGIIFSVVLHYITLVSSKIFIILYQFKIIHILVNFSFYFLPIFLISTLFVYLLVLKFSKINNIYNENKFFVLIKKLLTFFN